MRRRTTTRKPMTGAVMALLLGWAAAPIVAAGATARTVAAAEMLSLDADMLLSGDDALEIDGTAEKPCTLVGNGHQIKTKGPWTGRVRAAHCTFRQLGKPQAVIKVPNPGGWPGFKIQDPDVPALTMAGEGKAEWAFERCTFDQCSFLAFTANGETTLAFRYNTVGFPRRVRISARDS